MARNNDGTCGAIWYYGKGEDRAKHVCHRPDAHRGAHHADSGLAWTRHPHDRRPRMTTVPCADCEAVPAGNPAQRIGQ